MHRAVDAAVIGVISEGKCQLQRKAQLLARTETALEPFRFGLVQHRRAERHKARAHGVEDRGDLCRRRAGFVIGQKRVIKIAALRQRLRLFAFQRDDPLQRRCEGGPVFGAPRFGPDAVGDGRGPCDLGRQTLGHLHRAVVFAADVAQVRLAHRRSGPGLGQPFAHARIAAAGVNHRLDGAEFLSPLFGGGARHHGFLIPGQPPGDLGQRLGLALEGHEIVIGGHVRLP